MKIDEKTSRPVRFVHWCNFCWTFKVWHHTISFMTVITVNLKRVNGNVSTVRTKLVSEGGWSEKAVEEKIKKKKILVHLFF